MDKGTIEEQIIDEYTWHCKIEAESYKMMGKMLDETLIRERLDVYAISDLYIYGGAYLAAQLYRAVKDKVNVKGIVDKEGRSAVKVDIPVIKLEELRELYQDEKVIITPPRFYRAAKRDLSQFIAAENILFLGEFLEGLF